MSRDFVSFNRRPSNRSTQEEDEIFNTLQNLGLVPDKQKKQQRRTRQNSSSRSVDFDTFSNTSMLDLVVLRFYSHTLLVLSSFSVIFPFASNAFMAPDLKFTLI